MSANVSGAWTSQVTGSEMSRSMKIDPRAGQPASATDLVDGPKLITAYYEEQHDPEVSEQHVVSGTSGYRGSPFKNTFNEDHFLADLAGEKPITILTEAPGHGNPIGGIRVTAAHGWFAARPSGTEAIYKIYAESFCGEGHLSLIETEARTGADRVSASGVTAPMAPQLQETK
jgi:hypothetical protein